MANGYGPPPKPQPRGMHIECVIVCVNYADFLAHTLPENMQFFDRLVVVTNYADKETQGLCHRYSVECVISDCMHDQEAPLEKGRAINLGLAYLQQSDWVLQMDADILLPHDFRKLLQHARLKKENIYGADRVNIVGMCEFNRFKQGRIPGHQHCHFIEPPKGFPLGARLLHHEHGYAPLGYFQLWNGPRRYPIARGNAEHSDVLFSCQWPRYQRILLPEIIVCHLESEHKHMGANWNGRTTKRFDK